MTETVHRGEEYDTETYGKVRVLGFTERVKSADKDGVVDSELNVRFNIKPDESHILEHYKKLLPVEQFIEFVSEC